ncbi:MAG TPA: hypothetical protein VHR42_04275, partial [Clostridia bacterium]|nr:hypothetical protein [Clostridia bacterium]
MDFENLYQQVQTNQSTMNSHTANISNPHQVNYQQAGAEPAGSVSAHNNDSNAHGSLFVKNVTGSGAVLVTRNGNNVNVSVTGAGGGDMLTANYANGSGSSNANSVDRAKYSDDVSISKSTTLNNSSSAFQTGTSDTNPAPIALVDSSSVALAFNGRTLSNVITNGNFATSSNNLATGFTLSSASAVSCALNAQTFIATAQNGLILSPVQGVTNHRYFIIASVKATSNQVALSLQNATLTVPYHPGDGNYHTLYAIATLGSTAGYPYIQDRGTSGWQNISVQNFMAIDMGTDATNPYYNYTKDQMNNLINGYIDGTKSIVNPKFLSTGKNLFNSATITNGYAMGASGSPFVSSGWWASDFVPVVQGKTYIFTGLGPTTYSYVCFYSASKTFLSSLTNTAVISAGKMITVPAGAYYVRFAAASSAGAFQLE